MYFVGLSPNLRPYDSNLTNFYLWFKSPIGGKIMPPKYEERAKSRIKGFLKRFPDVLAKAEDAGFNESDTRTLVQEVLNTALGYDKFFEITSEFEIKGRYADFAVKLDNKIKFFIEVKAIGSKLTDKDIFQIQSYSASHNLPWMVLTNGRIWRCYHLTSGNPPDIEIVFEVDLLQAKEDLTEATNRLYLLSKEAVWRDAISDFWEVAKATSPTAIAQCLLSEGVLDEIRKELYRTTKQRIDNQTIWEVLTTQIIKGNILSQIIIPSKKARSSKKEVKKKSLPATCFAYVPDPNKPSTWKLRYRNPDGSVSPSHLAGAVAALSPGGFRGKKVNIPEKDLPKVKETLLSAYFEIGTPEKNIPPGIK
ncbi:MAG: hypothetical protein DRP41_07380 [Thermodesulfobacteriota bacterium]|nr:MAG: hypothetical protein DRP41_07380 [Thermodesulfobacteriota bacterium]